MFKKYVGLLDAMISNYLLFSYSVSAFKNFKMTIHILIDITYSCNRMARVHFQPDTILYQMSSNTNYMNLNFQETIILQSMCLKLKMGVEEYLEKNCSLL